MPGVTWDLELNVILGSEARTNKLTGWLNLTLETICDYILAFLVILFTCLGNIIFPGKHCLLKRWRVSTFRIRPLYLGQTHKTN